MPVRVIFNKKICSASVTLIRSIKQIKFFAQDNYSTLGHSKSHLTFNFGSFISRISFLIELRSLQHNTHNANFCIE